MNTIKKISCQVQNFVTSLLEVTYNDDVFIDGVKIVMGGLMISGIFYLMAFIMLMLG